VSRKYLVTEEVPNVPEDERFYVSSLVTDFRIEQYKAFATDKAAREYLHGFGVVDADIETEWYVP
jgi:hypothetical protein